MEVRIFASVLFQITEKLEHLWFVLAMKASQLQIQFLPCNVLFIDSCHTIKIY